MATTSSQHDVTRKAQRSRATSWARVLRATPRVRENASKPAIATNRSAQTLRARGHVGPPATQEPQSSEGSRASEVPPKDTAPTRRLSPTCCSPRTRRDAFPGSATHRKSFPLQARTHLSTCARHLSDNTFGLRMTLAEDGNYHGVHEATHPQAPTTGRLRLHLAKETARATATRLQTKSGGQNEGVLPSRCCCRDARTATMPRPC